MQFTHNVSLRRLQVILLIFPQKIMNVSNEKHRRAERVECLNMLVRTVERRRAVRIQSAFAIRAQDKRRRSPGNVFPELQRG